MPKGMRCPHCGRRTLLSVAAVVVIVLDCPGQAGRVYGRPEVLSVRNNAEVVCNSRDCDYVGTMAEVQKRKAGDSNTKV